MKDSSTGMAYMIISLLINAILLYYLSNAYYFQKSFNVFLIITLICQLIGIILLYTGYFKIGKFLCCAVGILFLPIGLIGFFGARKYVDAIEMEEFEEDQELGYTNDDKN